MTLSTTTPNLSQPSPQPELIGGEPERRIPDLKLFGIDRTEAGDKLGLEILSKSAGSDGKTRLRCIASSSVEDRHGDLMTEACVRGMAKQATGLTIFLNHSYRIPEDVFGYVESARSMRQDDTVLLLLTIVADESSNERVARAISQIENGVRAGVSIGAMLTDYKVADGHEEDWWPPLIIDAVELLEASIVGIPANPKSWVEQVIKTLDRKGLRAKRTPATASLEEVIAPVMLTATLEKEPEQYPEPLRGVDGPEEIAAHYVEQVEKGLWGTKGLEERLLGAVSSAIAYGIDHGDPADYAETSAEDIVGIIMAQAVTPVAEDKSAAEPVTPEAEASADGDPEIALEVLPGESGSGTAEEGAAQKDADDQLTKLAEAGSLTSLSELTDVLTETLVALSSERTTRAAAEAQRDALIEQLKGANATVDAAAQLVKTLMDLPAGRKSQMQRAVAESGISDRLKGSVYSEETLNLMEKGDTL